MFCILFSFRLPIEYETGVRDNVTVQQILVLNPETKREVFSFLTGDIIGRSRQTDRQTDRQTESDRRQTYRQKGVEL